jgi:hypothetical protein
MTSRDLLAQAQADLAWLERNGAIAGVAAVVAERRRQIEKHGYDLTLDGEHERGWLAREAILRLAGAGFMLKYDPQAGHADAIPELAAPGALAAAEIDQLTQQGEQT